MGQSVGLREKKKERTRRLIAGTARSLFAERGFEKVSVVEVAAAAEVSEATVFNYFRTKEDLVFEGMERFEQEMLNAVRNRKPGQSIVRAFGDFVLRPRGLLAAADDASARSLLAISRMIAESPGLQVRERWIMGTYTESLAAVIVEEAKASDLDICPRVVATALIGLHTALIAYARRRLLTEGADRKKIAQELVDEGARALRLLEDGLHGYV